MIPPSPALLTSLQHPSLPITLTHPHKPSLGTFHVPDTVLEAGTGRDSTALALQASMPAGKLLSPTQFQWGG